MEANILIIVVLVFSLIFSLLKIHHEAKKKRWETVAVITAFVLACISVAIQYKSRLKQQTETELAQHTILNLSRSINDLSSKYKQNSSSQNSVNTYLTGGYNIPIVGIIVVSRVDTGGNQLRPTYHVRVNNITKHPLHNLLIEYNDPLTNKPYSMSRSDYTKEMDDELFNSDNLKSGLLYLINGRVSWDGPYLTTYDFKIRIKMSDTVDNLVQISYEGPDGEFDPVTYLKSHNVYRN